MSPLLQMKSSKSNIHCIMASLSSLCLFCIALSVSFISSAFTSSSSAFARPWIYDLYYSSFSYSFYCLYLINSSWYYIFSPFLLSINHVFECLVYLFGKSFKLNSPNTLGICGFMLTSLFLLNINDFEK